MRDLKLNAVAWRLLGITVHVLWSPKDGLIISQQVEERICIVDVDVDVDVDGMF